MMTIKVRCMVSGKSIAYFIPDDIDLSEYGYKRYQDIPDEDKELIITDYILDNKSTSRHVNKYNLEEITIYD